MKAIPFSTRIKRRFVILMILVQGGNGVNVIEYSYIGMICL